MPILVVAPVADDVTSIPDDRRARIVGHHHKNRPLPARSEAARRLIVSLNAELDRRAAPDGSQLRPGGIGIRTSPWSSPQQSQVPQAPEQPHRPANEAAQPQSPKSGRTWRPVGCSLRRWPVQPRPAVTAHCACRGRRTATAAWHRHELHRDLVTYQWILGVDTSKRRREVHRGRGTHVVPAMRF